MTGLAAALGQARGLSSWPAEVPPSSIECPDELVQSLEPRHLPELYQATLSVTPVLAGNRVEWKTNNLNRRNSGSYFTPPHFVDRLVQSAVASWPSSVCDPACGAGAFLIAAAQKMSAGSGSDIQRILDSSIYGCDTDAVAIQLCHLMIWLETGASLPVGKLVLADALTLDWQATFATAFNDGGFDTVIGNPPFGGVVDGRVPEHIKALRPSRYPNVGGTADYSFYFVNLAQQIAKPKGSIAFVMPRGFLSARSAENLRTTGDRRCRVIEACSSHNAFDGAAIHVCLVGFDSQPFHDEAAADPEMSPRCLNITASLTVSEAYELAPNIVDQRIGKSPKLLTTGLINPESNLWGQVTCRYLRAKYMHPRMPVKHLRSSRRAAAKKPKLIIAGLSKTIECFLDKRAEYIGSVSTYTITHPSDDMGELERAMKHLHSKEVATRFRMELGASALGGGNITLTKRFLRQVLGESGF